MTSSETQSADHLKASGSLTLLTWEGAGCPQKAKHLVHHIRVVDRLHTHFLHLFNHLFLFPSFLFFFLFSLSVLFGQLGQTLLEGRNSFPFQ